MNNTRFPTPPLPELHSNPVRTSLFIFQMRNGRLREVRVLSSRIICLANSYRPWERECLDVTPDSCTNWGAYPSAPQGPRGWPHLPRRPAWGGAGTGRARGAGRDTGADSVGLTGMFIQARGQRHLNTGSHVPRAQPGRCPVRGKLVNDDHEPEWRWKLSEEKHNAETV